METGGFNLGGVNLLNFKCLAVSVKAYGLGVGVSGCSTDVALITLNTTRLALGRRFMLVTGFGAQI